MLELMSPTYLEPLAQDITALPESVVWLLSRPWAVRIKVFDERCSLKDSEKEQQRLDWALPGSQLCLSIFTASNRRLLVIDALQPLSGEEERVLCDNFTFMITAQKLEEIELEKALKAHIPVWLVPKNEVDFFKSGG
jgi:hypothetical protein